MSKHLRNVLALLLCLCLLPISLPAAADGGKGVPFILCNTGTGWGISGGTTVADGQNYTQAPASLLFRITVADNGLMVLQRTLPVGVDATGCTHLELDIYVERDDFFQLGSGQLEISSSGTCDVAELCFSSGTLAAKVKKGWNHLVLPLSQGSRNSTQAGRDFDLSNVNFFRLYLTSVKPGTELLLRLDNLFFTDGTGGALPDDTFEPGAYTAPDLAPAGDGRAWGDVDCSGGVNSVDALIALQYSVRLMALDYDALAVADVNNDGQINSVDALMMLQHSVRLIDAFPIARGWAGAETVEVNTEAPHLVHTLYPTDDAVVAITDVVRWGANGDGETDDTAAFGRALDYAEAQGGGTVFVPVGSYRLSRPLTVPRGVTLKGDAPPVDCGEVQGTLLLLTAGREDENGAAALTLHEGSGLENMTLYYPEQTMDAIVPYPWTINMASVHGLCLENVRLVNSYRGIRLGNGGGNALQNLHHVVGTALQTGFYIDYNVDICRLNDVRFTPDCWVGSGLGDLSGEAAMRAYVRQNATAFKIERVDWTYMAALAAEGYAVGVHTSRSTIDATSAGSCNGHIWDLTLTDCGTGVYMEHSNYYGIMITKGSILADCPVRLGEDFTNELSLNGLSLQAAGPIAVDHRGTGAVSLCDCTVTLPDRGGESALYATRGPITAVCTAFNGGGAAARAVGDARITLTNCTVDTDALYAGSPTGVILRQDDSLTFARVDNGWDFSPRRAAKPAGDTLISLTGAAMSGAPEQDVGPALQAAVDEVYAAGGGVVYLPAGYWRLEQPITVRPGVEIRGASDSPHHSVVPSTCILTDCGRSDPTGPALFTLQSRAGLKGLAVAYTGQGVDNSTILPYAPTVRGQGSDVYVVDVTLVNPWTGVDLDTYRCDGHLVDGVTGSPLAYGVIVGGGSTGGTVRNCHFNPHEYSGSAGWPGLPRTDVQRIYDHQVKRHRGFVVRDTVDEVMFHNFVFGAYSGLCIEDGADVIVLCHGTDGGNQSLTAEGTPKRPVTLVDSQLVVVGSGDILTYVRLKESFRGTLHLIQTNMWGNPKRSVQVEGGTLNLIQGNVFNVGPRGLVLDHGSMLAVALRLAQASTSFNWYIGSDATAAASYGCLYANSDPSRFADFAGVLRGTDFIQ